MTLAAGTTLGPYEILSPIGAGGMGEVYRARDTRLKRDVAVKVIPEQLAKDPGALARFEREAQAVAALSHPNVLAIYDVGTQGKTSYVVMELLEGETLRERIRRSAVPWRKAVEYGVLIADGLAAAHAKGIIHRDLKPENIFITSDGVLKILDFGLARVTAEGSDRTAEDQANTPTMTLDTRPGTIIGTVSYMSPEQVRGQKTDQRGDIFAFGCVLYEMVTGHRAFRGDTSADTISAILREEPESLTTSHSGISPELDRVIIRCLDKKPQQRFQSSGDLSFTLRNILSSSGHTISAVETAPPKRRVLGIVVATVAIAAVALFVALNRDGLRNQVLKQATPSSIRSLAVLPLESRSADPEQEIFVDAMTEAITDDLAKISALQVTSSRTMMRYKKTDVRLSELARELGVDAFVTGSAVQIAGRVQIRARLIDAASERQLWSNHYEREKRDILAMQNEVARAIADEIAIELTPAEKALLATTETVNTEAYDAYARGLAYVHRGTKEACRTALRFFEQAIEIDPDFALAHAGRARAYYSLADYHLAPKETMPFVKSAALDALALDENLAEAHTALGYVRLDYEWNWPAAKEAFERALELNPSLSDARLGYAAYLTAMNRGDEAMAQLDMVQELDPAARYTNQNQGLVSFMAHQYSRTINDSREALKVDPEFWPAHANMGLAQEQLGEHSSAIHHVREALKLSDSPLVAAMLGGVLANAGKREEAKTILETLKKREDRDYVCPYELATISIGLGDHDEAFAEMDRACDGRASCMPWLQVDPRLDPIRSDTRFDTLLKRVGFEPPSRLRVAEGDEPQRILLAVLPFEGTSSDADTEYLKDEIPASIIHSLSSLSDLRVIPRSTAFRYDVGDRDTAAIGRNLGATAVLTGQINARGDALSIRAELVDVATNRQLWDERYNRKLADILAIEEDIARQISEALRLQLTGEDQAKLTKRYTDNAEAYQLYLKGRYHWNKRSEAGFTKAIKHFSQALQLDPSYALACCGQSDAYITLVEYGYWAPNMAFPLARSAAIKALSADDTLAEAHTSLGSIHHWFDWDWAAAEHEFKRAIELEPRYATAHQWYSEFLSSMGRFDEAIAAIDRAKSLAPASLIVNTAAGWARYHARQYDEAIRLLQETLEMDSSFALAHIVLGRTLIQSGQLDEAIEEFRAGTSLAPSNMMYRAELAHAYAVAGEKEKAVRIAGELVTLSESIFVSPTEIAKIYAALGDHDKAFTWLERGYEQRDTWMSWLAIEPVFDNLRADPRFDDLLQRVGLNAVPSPKTHLGT